MKHRALFVGALLATIFIVAFGATYFIFQKNNSEDQTAEGTLIVTSFYPMYVATANVTSEVDGITLTNLSEPQTGCLHDYQLTTADMKLLKTADIFIVNGGGIESFLTDVAEECPNLTIIDASEGIERLNDNPHVWMSIARHRMQVENIAKALAESDASHADAYLKNAAAYDAKLAKLEREETELAASLGEEQVILFQESFAYLAENLGLEVTYVMDLDEERQVSAGEVSEVLRAVEKDNVHLILADAVYGAEMGQMVERESEATCIWIDPLVRGDYDADSYIDGMRANLEALREK